MAKYTHSLIIAFLVVIAYTVLGQSSDDKNYKAGELIIQLERDVSLDSFLKQHDLTFVHTISSRFNIYLLEFEIGKTSNYDMVSTLKTDSRVINVQNNHLVSLRISDETFPNDSLFHKQWSKYNTGLGSGYEGADISAVKAWDITRGGLTAHGDTIVVAIIDGGSDLDHEDLNFWKNHSEIPNNNIDDDNNGYIDDYDGWNAYDHNGTIPDNVHGVHVCGIAGAIGNNSIGIAGVNWNVKTLPIAGESSYESIVVEALSYVYVVRERYDQTNGAEGAFIVAQNNSFGVDKGKPEQFPVWEAMYDSLGTLGILSMGATANRAWDIDSVGDVPTAFTTDFLISVTNTNNRDEKYAGAAWGETTIDLGAPGTMVWSLGLNDTYRRSTGTSMATPQVTGAAALLMAAADSAFITNYKNNPSEGALLIKQYILDGTDELRDLEGKTVSGGRLNLFKSLKLMLGDPPFFEMNTDSINSFMSIFSYDTTFMIIENGGGDTLKYSVNIEDQPSWISLSNYSGSLVGDQKDTISIYFNSQAIDTGNHYCSIDLISSDTIGAMLPVSLYVYDNSTIDDEIITNFYAYPNPAIDKFTFALNAKDPSEIKINIYDSFGRRIKEITNPLAVGHNKIFWNIDKAKPGIYYYQISTEKAEFITGKIIVNKQ